MAARDPETGRFVSGSGGRRSSWNELDAQHIIVTYDDPDSGHTDLLEETDSVLSFEPLGGLAREELAELVGWYRTSAHHYTASGSPNAVMEFAWELSLDSTAQTILQEADDVTATDEPVTGIDLRNLDLVDIDILDHFEVIFATPMEDETNGTGQGGTYADPQRTVNYRAEYGEGPVMDRHDEMHVHAGFNESGAGGKAFEARVAYTFLWDVFERS